jgi:flagellar protein FlaJ
MWKPLVDIGYRFFGKNLENSSLARDFQRDLVKASIPITAEEYLSGAFLASVIVPIFLFPLIFLVFIVFGLPLTIAVLVVPFAWIMFGGITFIGFYVYPAIRIEEAKKSAQNSLPFATIYLSTLSGTGMPINRMMEILATFKEYGEVSTQAGGVVRDIEILGYDISTALEKAAARTPSPELKELFWGINTSMTTGGDLKKFLTEKSRSYMQMYKRALDAYVEQLSMLTEIYITAVIVGSIFFIVMTTIMNMIGVTGTMLALIQNLVIYLLLPLVSIGFMIIVSATSPV